jgi:hypothetical protein
MAQVERRKRNPKKTRKPKRAEKLFSMATKSQNKGSKRNKNKFGKYFDQTLNIDQEKHIINRDELKNSDLILTFEKPKARFNKFLGKEHSLMKDSSQKENKKNKEELELLKDGDYIPENEKQGFDEGNGQDQSVLGNKIEEEKNEKEQIIELEVEIEDQSNIKEKEDFIKNTQNVYYFFLIFNR